MNLLFTILFSLNVYSNDEVKMECTIQNGVIAGQKYSLEIFDEGQQAYFHDEAENEMYCNKMKVSTINMVLKNIKNSKPAADNDMVYYCIGANTFSISVIDPEMTGEFYISKFAFDISCK